MRVMKMSDRWMGSDYSNKLRDFQPFFHLFPLSDQHDHPTFVFAALFLRNVTEIQQQKNTFYHQLMGTRKKEDRDIVVSTAGFHSDAEQSNCFVTWSIFETCPLKQPVIPVQYGLALECAWQQTEQLMDDSIDRHRGYSNRKAICK